jgi:hypothetical protein
MVPDADIWRAATLMLKHYGEHADSESAGRANELAAEGDREGAAVWRLITDAIAQLANTNTIRPGALSEFIATSAIGNPEIAQ